MIYIKFEENKYPCKVSTFHTQKGKDAVRIVSDAPIAEDGFLLVGEDDSVVVDYSDYKYLYRSDVTTKEYTAEE